MAYGYGTTVWASDRASLQRFLPSNRKANKEIKVEEDWGYAGDAISPYAEYARDAIAPYGEYAGNAIAPFASPPPSPFLAMAMISKFPFHLWLLVNRLQPPQM